MRLIGKLMVVGGLVPGAAIMFWGFISVYGAIGRGGDVDGTQLGVAAERAIVAMKVGVPIAMVGAVVWIVGAMRRPRPHWRAK